MELLSQDYSVTEPAPHSLHECTGAEDFCRRFEHATGQSILQVTHQLVEAGAPQAVFLVGSVPLGMATPGSDIDIIVVVDGKTALLARDTLSHTNTRQRLAFLNDSDSLRVGMSLAVINGITVDIAVVVASSVQQIQARLRHKGPELSEVEIMTLGRLATGWLLWQSDGYLLRNALTLTDPALAVHCSTRNFVSALGFRQKGLRALDLGDLPLALHLGRSSVEMAYLAYFASEGLSYLGAKWLAQIGHGRDAAARLSRHPLLQEGVRFLFPAFVSDPVAVRSYLQEASGFLTSMRSLIEQRTRFRIAFMACPLIHTV
jgi:hypothetical protein